MSTREQQPPKAPPKPSTTESQTPTTGPGSVSPAATPAAASAATKTVAPDEAERPKAQASVEEAPAAGLRPLSPTEPLTQEEMLQQLLQQVTSSKSVTTAESPLPARAPHVASSALTKDPDVLSNTTSPSLQATPSSDSNRPGGAERADGKRVADGGSGSGSGADSPGKGGPIPPTLRDQVDEITEATIRIEATVRRLDPIENMVREGQQQNRANSLEIVNVKSEIALGIESIREETGAANASVKRLTAEVHDNATTLSQGMEALHKEVKIYRSELTPTLQGSQRDREELRSSLAVAQKAIDETQHTATETRREIQQLQAALSRSDSNIVIYRDELKNEIHETKENIADLSSKVNERLTPEIKSVVNGLKIMAERSAPVLDDVKIRLASLEGSLRESVVHQAKTVTETLARLVEETRQRDRHLQDTQTCIQQSVGKDLREQLGHIASAAALNTLNTHIERRLAEVTRKQDQSQKSLDGLTAVIPSDLISRFEMLSAGLTSLSTATASEKSLKEIAERVEDVERSVGSALSEKLGQRLEQIQNAVSTTQKSLSSISTSADVQSIQIELQSIRKELQSTLQLAETRLTNKIEATTGLAQQLAEGTAEQVQGIDTLKEPVRAVQRSVGDALEYRLEIMRHDLKETDQGTKSKLDALAIEVAAAHSTIAKTLVPGLAQAQAASDAVGARMDRRSDRLEGAVLDAATTVSRALKERVDALAQGLSLLGSQRIQDHGVLVQLLNQLRTDLMSPLDSLRAAVEIGLAQHHEDQTDAIAVLRHGTTEQLGELSTIVTSVRERTDSLLGDLNESRSTLSALAAAIGSNQAALISELVNIRTTTQEGLVGTLRASTKDLADRVQTLDAKVETRVDAVQREIIQLGRSSVQQQMQVIADVSAIRDLVRADNGLYGQLANDISRKLEDTQLRIRELAGAAGLHQNTVLSNLAQVHSAIANGFQKDLELTLNPILSNQHNQAKTLVEVLEKNIHQMVEKLRMQLEREFTDKLGNNLSKLNEQTSYIHRHIESIQKDADTLRAAEKLRAILKPDFDRINEQLSPIEAIAQVTKKEIERDGGDLKTLKKQTADIESEVKALGAEVRVKLPANWKGFKIYAATIIITAMVICGVSSWLGYKLSSKAGEEKSGRIWDGIMKAMEEKTIKLNEAQLLEIKTFCQKPVVSKQPSPPRPSSKRSAQQQAGAPLGAAPPITNTISICSSCGPSGQGVVSEHCTGCGGTMTPSKQSSRSEGASPTVSAGLPRNTQGN